jgi:hypothetical protein
VSDNVSAYRTIIKIIHQIIFRVEGRQKSSSSFVILDDKDFDNEDAITSHADTQQHHPRPPVIAVSLLLLSSNFMMMMNHSRFADVLMLSFLVVILVQDTLAFSSVQVFTRTSTRTTTTVATYMSILDELDENNDEKLPESFNPLNYKATKSNSAYSYSGTTISLRKTTMQEMTNALLTVAGNIIESETLLQEYKDFLLEPLDDLEAVLVRKH